MFLVVMPLAVVLLATVGGTEVITFKTYYPSPYGSYQKMKITKSLTVGDRLPDGTYTPLDISGSVNVTGSVGISGAANVLRLEPQSCAGVTNSVNGAVCFNTDGKLKVYYNGWKDIAGGDTLVSAVSQYSNSYTVEIMAPASADYALIDFNGTLRFGSADGAGAETLGGAVYVDVGTGYSSGGYTIMMGRGDMYDYAGVWNGASYSGDNSTMGFTKTVAVSVSGKKITLTLPSMFAGSVPNFYVLAKYYRRG